MSVNVFAATYPTYKVEKQSGWIQLYPKLELWVHAKNPDASIVVQRFKYKKPYFFKKENIAKYLKDQQQARSIANVTIKVRDWVVTKHEFTESKSPRYQKLSIEGTYKDDGKTVLFKEVEYFMGNKSVQLNVAYPESSPLAKTEVDKVFSHMVVIR